MIGTIITFAVLILIAIIVLWIIFDPTGYIEAAMRR